MIVAVPGGGMVSLRRREATAFLFSVNLKTVKRLLKKKGKTFFQLHIIAEFQGVTK